MTAERWSHPEGTVYLLHLDRPYRHARHYLGWSANLPARLAAHEAGSGSRLMAVVRAAGIGYQLVRTWPREPRATERRLKRQHGAGALCPVCRPGAGRGRWPRIATEPHRAEATRAGRCRHCRGRLAYVEPRAARAHWRHITTRQRGVLAD